MGQVKVKLDDDFKGLLENVKEVPLSSHYCYGGCNGRQIAAKNSWWILMESHMHERVYECSHLQVDQLNTVDRYYSIKMYQLWTMSCIIHHHFHASRLHPIPNKSAQVTLWKLYPNQNACRSTSFWGDGKNMASLHRLCIPHRCLSSIFPKMTELFWTKKDRKTTQTKAFFCVKTTH